MTRSTQSRRRCATTTRTCASAGAAQPGRQRRPGARRGCVCRNNASDVSVEPWLDGQRTVRFTLPIQLPTAIQKVIGVERIPVTEQQHLEHTDAGGFVVRRACPASSSCRQLCL